MFKVIHGEIWSEDFTQLNQLVEDYSSCMRFAFCRFQKDHNDFDDTRNLCNWQYKSLNTRQISDAVLRAEGMYTLFGKQKVIFGGRKNWEKLQAKIITKKEWKNIRNNQIYSRGSKDILGNPNIRVVDRTLRITVGYRKFVFYKLFVPKKYKEELQHLLLSGQAYNVRLIRKDLTHFKVNIEYQIENPQTKIGFENGTIGIDTNPDRIAVCEITKDGNYVKSFSLTNEKLLFASENKRDYEIALLVKQIIQYAQETKKGIIFENLKFRKQFDNNHRSNRMKSNFIYSKFLQLLESKCIEFGISYKKVRPEFTSIIGNLKYKNIFNLSIHEAAAFVIARRGLGFQEKLSLQGYNRNEVRNQVLSILRNPAGKYKVKEKDKISSWKLWSCLKGNVQTVLTGLSSNMSNLKELDDLSLYDKLENESENLSGKIFLPELIIGSKSNLEVKESLPFKTS